MGHLPSLFWRADLLVREPGFIFGDQGSLVSATAFGRVDKQLCMTYEASECDAAGDEDKLQWVAGLTCFVEREEPECGGINCFPNLQTSARYNRCQVRAYRDETVVLQNSRFPIAQTLSDFLPFLTIQNHAPKIRIYSMAFVESQAVLCHHIKLPAKG